jgi:hypothetical protein
MGKEDKMSFVTGRWKRKVEAEKKQRNNWERMAAK